MIEVAITTDNSVQCTGKGLQRMLQASGEPLYSDIKTSIQNVNWSQQCSGVRLQQVHTAELWFVSYRQLNPSFALYQILLTPVWSSGKGAPALSAGKQGNDSAMVKVLLGGNVSLDTYILAVSGDYRQHCTMLASTSDRTQVSPPHMIWNVRSLDQVSLITVIIDQARITSP